MSRCERPPAGSCAGDLFVGLDQWLAVESVSHAAWHGYRLVTWMNASGKLDEAACDRSLGRYKSAEWPFYELLAPDEEV